MRNPVQAAQNMHGMGYSEIRPSLGSRRSLYSWRRVALAWFAASVGLGVVAPAALAYDPVEGYWASQGTGGGSIKAQAVSPGHFRGTIERASASCAPASDGFIYYPHGYDLWEVSGISGSTGTYRGPWHLLNSSDCTPTGSDGEIQLQLSADGNRMRYCGTTSAAGLSFDESGNPRGDTQCTNLIKEKGPDWPDLPPPAPPTPSPTPARSPTPSSSSSDIPPGTQRTYTFMYVVKFPSQSRRCRSRRHFRIRLRNPAGTHITSAVIRVGGRIRAGLGRSHVVDLRGLPRGRFRVSIVAVTANGHIIRGSRVFRTCAHKR